MRTAKYEDFISQNVAPQTSERISVYNAIGERVGSFGLSRLRFPNVGERLYSFGAISDVHLQRNTAKDDFQRALTYYSNTDTSFVCVCGDLTESGYAEQLAEYKTWFSTYATKPVYAVSGNHESYGGLDIASIIETYTGKPLYYSFAQGNDVFIMLGIVGESNLFTTAELQWLY